jgi:uncharacterized OB-fold protein
MTVSEPGRQTDALTGARSGAPEEGQAERGEAVPEFVLPERVTPVPDPTGLDAPYWTAAAEGRLVVQRCLQCERWQWGPEWICYQCHSSDVGWDEVPTTDGEYRGAIYSWERVWHPTDRGLATAVPYVALLVALPSAGDIRMLGNGVDDPHAGVEIGAPVRAVFEHHETYSLVHWQTIR